MVRKYSGAAPPRSTRARLRFDGARARVRETDTDAELFERKAGRAQHAQQDGARVLSRRRAVVDAGSFQESTSTAGHDDGVVGAAVELSIRHVGAREDDRIVEKVTRPLGDALERDRKSTRLNSSHSQISY